MTILFFSNKLFAQQTDFERILLGKAGKGHIMAITFETLARDNGKKLVRVQGRVVLVLSYRDMRQTKWRD